MKPLWGFFAIFPKSFTLEKLQDIQLDGVTVFRNTVSTHESLRMWVSSIWSSYSGMTVN